MEKRSCWQGWLNAEVYQEFVEHWPIYAWLNRDLAAGADLETARRVLDLGSGTGATAAACLRRMRPEARLVGIDGSAEMVGVARSRVRDERALFVVADARAVGEAVRNRFDRIVANASFWLLPRTAKFYAALGALSEPDALLTFNVPAEEVAGEVVRPHAFQVALGRRLRGRHMSFARPTVALHPERLEERLGVHGFRLEKRESLVYKGRQRELIELMAIPAMTARLAPGLSAEERQAAVAEAAAAVDPGEEVEVPWVVFGFRRSGAGELRTR